MFNDIFTNQPLLAPLIALFSGILTSFLPCNLSTIPLIIGYVKENKFDKKESFFISLIYAVGMIISFMMIGFLATFISNFLSIFGKYIYLLLAFILILMLLNNWHIINIIKQNNILKVNTKKGYLGAFIMGLLSGLVLSPCSTPALLTILSISTIKGQLLYSIILMFMYGLGNSVLVILLGTYASKINELKKSKKYATINKVVEYTLNTIMIITIIYLLYLGI